MTTDGLETLSRASRRDFARAHPWLGALLFGFILFLALVVLRIFILQQETGSAIARAGVIAVLFATLSGFVQSYENRRRADPSNSWVRLLLTAATFILVVLWLFPYTGEDEQPPHFFNVFGQEISNHDEPVAVLWGLGAGFIVWFSVGYFGSSKDEDET